MVSAAVRVKRSMTRKVSLDAGNLNVALLE